MSENTRQYAKKNETKEKNPFSCKPDKDSSEPTSSPFAQVLYLQRTIGNRAVTRLIQSGAIQAKLKIGPPNDIYEKEADRMADRAMTIPESSIRQQPNEEEKEEIRAKPLARQITPLVRLVQFKRKSSELKTGYEFGQDLKRKILQKKNSGKKLEPSTKLEMESFFGQNFDDVRVHSDTQASTISNYLKANAFTVGTDIFFNSGKYDSSSKKGKHLIAHELTHVVQQRSTSSFSSPNNINISTSPTAIQFDSYLGTYRGMDALYLDQEDATELGLGLGLVGGLTPFIAKFTLPAKIIAVLLGLSAYRVFQANNRSGGKGVVIAFPRFTEITVPIPIVLPRSEVE